ncbi:hypothetical protein LNP05_06780 [Klebsiella pneumoniae subsp. pneumoniae]|nr:hypothetical protein [Klebsiella pneumoniae subsp. pneumoniae]
MAEVGINGLDADFLRTLKRKRLCRCASGEAGGRAGSGNPQAARPV